MSYKIFKAFIFLIFFMTSLSGCVSKGSFDGVNQLGQSVQLSYRQVVFSNDGTLEMIMPNGEIFFGKFVQNSTSSYGSGLAFGDWFDDEMLLLSESSATKSSLTKALLISKGGSTMKCQFQFSDPDYGIHGGGIGICENDSADEISFTF